MGSIKKNITMKYISVVLFEYVYFCKSTKRSMRNPSYFGNVSDGNVSDEKISILAKIVH